MAILIDTNVLLRAVQPGHPMNDLAVRALAALMVREDSLVVSIQNIAEFWSVATRPESNNGLGFSIEEARSELSRLEDFFEILHEDEASYDIWKDLIVANRVNGVQVHDARLVAVMMAHGIRQIVTFDMGDFRRYAAIEAIHPDKIE